MHVALDIRDRIAVFKPLVPHRGDACVARQHITTVEPVDDDTSEFLNVLREVLQLPLARLGRVKVAAVLRLGDFDE